MLKVGIIGAGMQGNRRIRTLQNNDTVSVIGVYDEQEDVLAAFSKQYGVQALPDANTVIENADVLLIATPTATHYELAAHAIKAQIPVFIESPATSSLRDCASLIKLADEAGCEIGVSAPVRFHPCFRLLRSSEHVQYVSIDRVFPSDPRLRNRQWQTELNDVLNICTKFAKSYHVRRAEISVLRQSNLMIQTLGFSLRFDTGTHTQVTLRFGHSSSYRVFAGSSGFNIEGDLLCTSLIKNGSLPISLPSLDLFSTELNSFLSAVQDKTPVPVSVQDGYQVMRLAERLMEKLR